MRYRRLSTLINTPVLPAGLVIAFLTLTAFTVFQGQDKRSTQDKFDETQFPIVEEYSVKPRNIQERAKGELKAKRFRLGALIVSLPHWGVVAGIHPWPADFSALPVAESTTIVVGDVMDATANLSDDRMAVYSDFTISPTKVLKDSCNFAKENSLLTASRYGGRVKFQDGHALLVFMSNLGMPRVGRHYLFFLKQTDADFDIVTAYEIKGDKVTPLDSGTSAFDNYKNASEADVLREIQQKIKGVAKTALSTGEGK
jgi:hypothetical protein